MGQKGCALQFHGLVPGSLRKQNHHSNISECVREQTTKELRPKLIEELFQVPALKEVEHLESRMLEIV